MKNVIKTGLKMLLAAIKNQPWWIYNVCKNAIKSTSWKDFLSRHKELTIKTIEIMTPETKAFWNAVDQKFDIPFSAEEYIEEAKRSVNKRFK